MRKFTLFFFSLLIAAIALGGYFRWAIEYIDGYWPAAHSRLANIVPAPTPFIISAGVVPHHALAEDIIRDFFASVAEKAVPETIVLLSPDHFNAASVVGRSFIGLATSTEEFNGLKVDTALNRKLSAAVETVFGDPFMALEHGVTVFTPFIKEYFPAAKILPVLIPSSISKERLEHLADMLNSQASSRTMVVASVDFSHYLPASAAAFHDVKSINTLLNFRENDFKSLEVDCWQCLYAVRLFSRMRQTESSEIIAHKNSADYWKQSGIEETTSYFSVIFEKYDNARDEMANAGYDGKTVLFVGDVMLGRSVQNLMTKNGSVYPFAGIVCLFKGTDIISGNLEGPIVKEPVAFDPATLRFTFSPSVLDALRFAGFDLLTLANNHALDMGRPGLAETKQFLAGVGIGFLGDAVACGEDLTLKRDGMTFLAFNRTFSFSCDDGSIIRTIRAAKTASPLDEVIVNIHWGEEYQQKSSTAQRRLAHEMIDAGADLIIGHHPHVVQEIEIYKAKPIFYSLGNFVFDQYFSRATQEGLAVGLEIYPAATVYRLFPVKIRASQPVLMDGLETAEFLSRLAARSVPDLTESILKGIIEIGK